MFTTPSKVHHRKICLPFFGPCLLEQWLSYDFFQFAASLTCLGEEHFEEFGSSSAVLLRIFLNADPPEMIAMGSLGLFFIFLFIIFVVLGMLNILIAQLWSTYEEIHHHKQGLAMMHRAEICIVSDRQSCKDVHLYCLFDNVMVWCCITHFLGRFLMSDSQMYLPCFHSLQLALKLLSSPTQAWLFPDRSFAANGVDTPNFLA